MAASAALRASCVASTRAWGRSITRPTRRTARLARRARAVIVRAGAAPLLPGASSWTGVGSGFRVYRDALEQRYAGRLQAISRSVPSCARRRCARRVPVRPATSLAAEAAAPVYIEREGGVTIDERRAVRLWIRFRVPAPHRADLDAVVAIERAITPSVDARQLRRFAREPAITAGSSSAAAEIVGYTRADDAAGEAHLLNLSVAGAVAAPRPGCAHDAIRPEARARLRRPSMLLEVRPSNDAARALYRARVCGDRRRRGYYPEGEGSEDAMVFDVELRDA